MDEREFSLTTASLPPQKKYEYFTHLNNIPR